MPLQAAARVQDRVEAQLIECAAETPPSEPVTMTPATPPAAPSPTRHAQAATVEQTGADPPPD